MKEYIFLTSEGFTFQPSSNSILPDIENLQVVGFANGVNAGHAFNNLLSQNYYLKETNFSEVFSYELAKGFNKSKKYHIIPRQNKT